MSILSTPPAPTVTAAGAASLADRLSSRVRSAWRKNASTLPTFAAIVIFVAMVIYGQASYGKILQPGTISSLLNGQVHMVVLAVGMTFVIISGGIDLSVGAVIAFTSVSGVMLINAGWNSWVVMVLMVGIGTTFGLLSGVLIRFFDVQPFIATLATMFLARGLASMLSTDSLVLDSDSQLRLLSRRIVLIDGPKTNDLAITPSLLIVVVVVAAAFFVLHRTRFGRTVYAIGGSENSAQLMGLPVQRVKLSIYPLSGALAGLAAVLYTSLTASAQNITGLGWELDAIAAVVIGGTLLTGGAGFVLGSVMGVFVFALLALLINRDGKIDALLIPIITGAILLVFVLLQRAVTARRR